MNAAPSQFRRRSLESHKIIDPTSETSGVLGSVATNERIANDHALMSLRQAPTLLLSTFPHELNEQKLTKDKE